MVFLLAFPNRASEVAIAPEGVLFREVPFEKLVISVSSPESERKDLLEQPHNLQCGILWRVTSEEMDVVFIYFHLHDLEAFLVFNVSHELLDLFAEADKEFFAIFANVSVALREGAKVAGPQGPLCHWLMAAKTPPVLGVRSAAKYF
jgi:hypothetical protein